MFSYEEIQRYSETDIKIYKYIISNSDKIQYMTIRELAKELHVSCITNSSRSTLAKLSDWNFSYNLDPKRMNGGYNGTTQVPVIFIIEALAKRI